MVVTAGACQGLCQKCFREDVDLIVDPAGLVGANVDRRMRRLPQMPEARADDRFVEPFHRMPPRFCQQITGNMFGHELIVGHIGIECPDHVVAVLECLWHLKVEFVPVRLGEAHEIEPISCPAFTVVRRFEQAIYDAFISQRRIIGKKGTDFGCRRGEPDEIKCHAPHQSAFVGRLSGRETRFVELRQDEIIHRRLRPVFVLDGRRRRKSDGLKRPLLCLPCGKIEFTWFIITRPFGRPRRATFDPCGEGHNLLVGQFSLGGHLDVADIPNGLDQQAVAGFARFNGGSIVASLKDVLSRIEP